MNVASFRNPFSRGITKVDELMKPYIPHANVVNPGVALEDV